MLQKSLTLIPPSEVALVVEHEAVIAYTHCCYYIGNLLDAVGDLSSPLSHWQLRVCALSGSQNKCGLSLARGDEN